MKDYFVKLGGLIGDWDQETDNRVERFCTELQTKRHYEKFTTFPVKTADEMITAKDLRLFSICEHHLLPFYGKVAIGYIPTDKIFGLSKFQRIVDKFASKPQIQETLTTEIANFIVNQINPKGLGIVVKAVHTCVFARGVQSPSAEFVTNYMYGNFRENVNTRNEFLNVVYNYNNSR